MVVWRVATGAYHTQPPTVTVMAIFGLWVCLSILRSMVYPRFKQSQVINKAGGLVYERSFGGMPAI